MDLLAKLARSPGLLHRVATEAQHHFFDPGSSLSASTVARNLSAGSSAMNAPDERLTLGRGNHRLDRGRVLRARSALIGQRIELIDWQKREILRIYDNPAGAD